MFLATHGVIRNQSQSVLSLDLYGTPTVWYEMVKRFSAYSGPCIRVRRSSDNTEMDIPFVSNLLDTATLLSFVGLGDGFVTTFYTQVGTYNLSQPNATSQPQIVSSGSLITANGFTSIRYDGADDNLFNWSSAFINSSDVSYFSISQCDTAGGVGVVHTQHNALPYTVRTFCDRRVQKLSFVINNTATTGYDSLLSIQRDDANLRLSATFVNTSQGMSSFDNGATGTTNTWTGTTNNNGLMLGSQYNSGGSIVTTLNGSINCFGSYNFDNSGNRLAIQTVLNNYYNIY